ncbi:MAG TPA: hypothetical protein VFX61_07320 [Micromonosporaceae bacterium]|nr:hypothetical protein [Micromonosporaceae bacterium]
MSLSSALIAAHAAAGAAGLLLAGPVLFAPKPGPRKLASAPRDGAPNRRKAGRLHVLLGRAYALATAVLCLTAFGLVAYDPVRLAGLAVLGVLTAGWVGAGVWLARRRPRLGGPGRWRIWHLNCMGSSVISFVTAFAVQATDGHLVAWLAPTLIGSPLIAWRTRREAQALPGAGKPTGAAEATA